MDSSGQLYSAPKVSIVIPVFNGSNYMHEAIGSALGQTYSNLEVIVVNDGSSDNGMTDAIAKSYGNRIKYYKKENGGVATALNLGIEKMEGEYFAWLSHDDIFDYRKIEQEIKIIVSLEDKKTFLVGGYTVINKSGERLYEVNLCSQHTQEELERPLFAVFRGGINGCATLIHKSHFERAGMFDPGLPTTQDYDMWFRMLRGQKIYYHNACLAKSRTHQEQDSRKLIDKHTKECSNLWINMMSSLTDEERTAIAGSPYLFYLNTGSFLRNNTEYTDAILYARKQAAKIGEDQGHLNDADFQKVWNDMTYNQNDLPEVISAPDFYRDEYEKVMNSISWRITKPLRWVRKMFLCCKRSRRASIK